MIDQEHFGTASAKDGIASIPNAIEIPRGIAPPMAMGTFLARPIIGADITPSALQAIKR